MCTPRLGHSPGPGYDPHRLLPMAPVVLASTMRTGLHGCPWEMSLPGWMLHLVLPSRCPSSCRSPPGAAGLPALSPQSSRQVPAASCLIAKAKTIVLWLLCSELPPKTQAGLAAWRGRNVSLWFSCCHWGSGVTWW